MSIRSANRGTALVVAAIFAVTPVLQALPQTPPPQAKPVATAKPATAKPAAARPRDRSRLAAQLHHAEPGTRHRLRAADRELGEPEGRWSRFAAASVSGRGRGRDGQAGARHDQARSRHQVSLEERLVNFANMRITESNFPTLPKEQLREIVAEITKAIPEDDRVIALDRVLAFVDKSTIVPKDVPGLKADPPVIFFSNTPAVVVNFDGEPIWSPIEKNDLKFAVNTNWDVFEHEPTKTFYLRYNDSWLTATTVTGPWTAAGKLPPSFSSLPADESFADVKKAVPGKSLPANQRPKVNVSMVPAELILLRGAPSYLLVNGTQGSAVGLQHRERRVPPRQDRARLLPRGRTMVLGAGFHRTVDVRDAEAAGRLQEDPARTRTLARARVGARHRSGDRSRAARAGAADGARRSSTKIEAPAVSYNGAPEFTAIEGTSLQRARQHRQGHHPVRRCLTTTATRVSGSPARPPTGPWAVATTIPAEIYKIPASSPSHHVTYVVVEEDDNDNDEWVTFAYAAGYTGLMIGWGCAVWGSGWYYPPYVLRRDLLPAFRRLRVFRALQPVDRCVRTQCRRVRTVRRRGRERAL